MHDTSDRAPEQARDEDARLTIRIRRKSSRYGGSIAAAIVLLALDVGYDGSYLMSAGAFPFWFLGSILNNVIQRPGWRLALTRIAIPVLTLGLVLTNYSIQSGVATANAARIITACAEFHAANGSFPQTLDELVPRYLPSVPRAKYCLDGKFSYWNIEDHPILEWTVVGFCRRIYDFENRRWRYLD